MEHWIAQYGYLAVVVGTFLEGETVLLIAGALAQRGTLTWQGVAAAAFVGSMAGDQLWFYVGRRFGPSWLARRPRLQQPLVRAEQSLKRYGDRFVLGFRFIAGIRTVAPFLFGATSYSALRFALLNLLGAAVWSVAISLLGYSVGAGLKSLLDRAGHLEELALAAAVLGALGFSLSRQLWRRQHRPPQPSA